MNNKTYIIAEAGVNHNGMIEMAKSLVDAAVDAGADAVKFQTFKADNLATKAAPKAAYQKKSGREHESQLDMLKKLELSQQAHIEIIKHCEEKKIQFLTSAFDRDSMDFISTLCLPFIKVPSGEITNLPHLRHIAHLGSPVILSTGMATLEEINAALEVIISGGISRKNITLLHCHTSYPTRFEDVNLRAMLTMAGSFPGIKIGFSDHTVGIEASVAAVAIGATLIEKHFTLNRSLPGPDHSTSLEPCELKSMVRSIRNIEVAMGSGRKEPTSSELLVKQVVRKSIVAAKSIEVGAVFTLENLCTMRPGTGISPMQWDKVIGRHSNRTYERGELIDPQ